MSARICRMYDRTYGMSGLTCGIYGLPWLMSARICRIYDRTYGMSTRICRMYDHTCGMFSRTQGVSDGPARYVGGIFFVDDHRLRLLGSLCPLAKDCGADAD
jgi:hypothetical protein